MPLTKNVIVNSYDTRPTAPGVRVFFQLTRASRKPFQIPCVFFNESASCVQGDCKFICDAVDRAHIRCFFPEKICLAGILPHSLGSLSLCFLRSNASRVQCDCNSYDTRPTAPGVRVFFQLTRASRKPFQIPCVSQ